MIRCSCLGPEAERDPGSWQFFRDGGWWYYSMDCRVHGARFRRRMMDSGCLQTRPPRIVERRRHRARRSRSRLAKVAWKRLVRIFSCERVAVQDYGRPIGRLELAINRVFVEHQRRLLRMQ